MRLNRRSLLRYSALAGASLALPGALRAQEGESIFDMFSNNRVLRDADQGGNTMAAEALVAAHLRGEPNNAEAAALLSRSLAARGERDRATLLLDHAHARGG